MLALAERLALDRGLDWAFCDTDSLAIANTTGLDTAEFIRRVEEVRAWFEPLNPYEVKGPILQLEKVNFPIGQPRDAANLRPTNCLAISAKRYVLFDRDAAGAPAIRKASAHGLGHLVSPYPDPDRSKRIDRLGVELWQEDLWREIILAFDRGQPDQVDFEKLANLDQPAASRYAATNQALLAWFNAYNATCAPADRIWPFNFLLSFQAKSRMEMAATFPEALSLPAWRRREPHPASRYSSDLIADRPPVFDRKTSEPVPWDWLKSYGRSVVRHHLHSELKFQGGADDQRGTLRRRHVNVWAAIPIGKEADNLEEQEALGDRAEDYAVEWATAREDRAKLVADIGDLQQRLGISDRTLITRAGVSHHTLADLRQGRRLASHSLLNLAHATEELRKEVEAQAIDDLMLRANLATFCNQVGGRNALARMLGYSGPFIGRLISGDRSVSQDAIRRLQNVGFDPSPTKILVSKAIADGSPVHSKEVISSSKSSSSRGG